MRTHGSKRRATYLVLASLCLVAQVLAISLLIGSVQPVFAAESLTFGDTVAEQFPGNIGGGFVQAYVRVTISQPTTLTSVSMYLKYSGSAGDQCFKFGIYKDGNVGLEGHGSPASQPLVAATTNGYCLYGTGSWGPAWETWELASSDYLTIKTPGNYWLCVLASNSYGNIYHFSPLYTYGYNSTYGYNDFFFPALFDRFSKHLQQ